MTTTGAIISDEEIGRIAAMILNHIQEKHRRSAMKVRAAMIANLHAFEEMHGLPHAIPSLRERGLKDGPIVNGREGE